VLAEHLTTSAASFMRIRPWSTRMQVSWSPIASWISKRGHGGIDAAGQAADHLAGADLLADLLAISAR
jgi:hypothetical protein